MTDIEKLALQMAKDTEESGDRIPDDDEVEAIHEEVEKMFAHEADYRNMWLRAVQELNAYDLQELRQRVGLA